MKYTNFTSIEMAKEYLAIAKHNGKRGYVLQLTAKDFEVRTWG